MPLWRWKCAIGARGAGRRGVYRAVQSVFCRGSGKKKLAVWATECVAVWLGAGSQINTRSKQQCGAKRHVVAVRGAIRSEICDQMGSRNGVVFVCRRCAWSRVDFSGGWLCAAPPPPSPKALINLSKVKTAVSAHFTRRARAQRVQPPAGERQSGAPFRTAGAH